MEDQLVECFTMFGKKKRVLLSSLSFRPAAYGVIVQDGQVIVVNTRSTGKYSLPGGGVEAEETIEEGLKREIKEEIGIDIDIGDFIHFNENYFYYDPLNEAVHSYQYFFLCFPKTSLKGDHVIQDLEAFDPQWMTIDQLHEGNIQGPEIGILPVMHKLLGRKSEK
ncbi:MAG: NUDIX hydrolase [Candidatus Levybacteria bacterium]|nr:NUDIX hydrolase [Candidatus Levybacteria bacterium]